MRNPQPTPSTGWLRPVRAASWEPVLSPLIARNPARWTCQRAPLGQRAAVRSPLADPLPELTIRTPCGASLGKFHFCGIANKKNLGKTQAKFGDLKRNMKDSLK